MYLGLAAGIASGQLDFLSFYYNEYTLFSYITVSTSLLRILLLIIAIMPKSRIKTLILKYKNSSMLFVITYTIVFDILEKKMDILEPLHSRE